MTTQMNNQEIIAAYRARRLTIRELAAASNRSYNDVRLLLLSAGFRNGKYSHY